MKLLIPNFTDQTKLFDYLGENKSDLIAKKMDDPLKKGDSASIFAQQDIEVGKSEVRGGNESSDLLVKAIINTTNYMDSHDDVHVKGLWDESLLSKNPILHLQEHMMSFKTTISSGDDLDVYVKEYTWKELGYDLEGYTQALVFDSLIKQSRNPYMHEQYLKNYVQSHSVGMRYGRIKMAVKEGDAEEKALYNEYIGSIANKEYVDSKGYFFAVTKATVKEGSAVPMGSNVMTPTLSIETKSLFGIKKKKVNLETHKNHSIINFLSNL